MACIPDETEPKFQKLISATMRNLQSSSIYFLDEVLYFAGNKIEGHHQ